MGKNVVLFVDDEVQVLSAIRRAVIDEKFSSLFAGSGQEALEIMEKEDISVIVTDMRMPLMDGLMLLKKVKVSHPATVRIVLSGYTQLSQMLATINQGDIFKFIAKPWDLDEGLLHAIQQGIEYHNFQRYGEEAKKTSERRNVVYKNVLKMMESKVNIIKRDLDNIKKLDHWIFQFVENQTEEMQRQETYNPGKFLEQLELLRKLHLLYMDTLPSSFVGFDQKQLKKSLDELIVERQSEQQWKLNIKNPTELTCCGNYKVLMLVICTLIDYLLQHGAGSKVYCQVENNEMPESIEFNISMIAVVGARAKRFIDVEKLYAVTALFNEICAIDSIHIILHDREEELLLIIKSEFPVEKDVIVKSK